MLVSSQKVIKRPYRSHRFPACTRCRQRKIKCTSTQWGQECMQCYTHGTRCSFSNRPNQVSNHVSEGLWRPDYIPSSVDVRREVHFVGPLISTDTRILERCMSSEGHDGDDDGNEIVSNLPFSVLPPPRPPPSPCQCTRDLPREFLRAVDPHIEDLLHLFFRKIMPCLPTFNNDWFQQGLKSGPTASEALLCTICSLSLYYWNLSKTSKPIDKPSQDVAWQATAVTNIRSHVQCDLSTILSTIYNVVGRPSLCILSNTTDVARLVALSHAIGLHHDSSSWRIPQAEKDLRHNTWWAVLNVDRFYHFARGSPSLISDGHCDVPLPSLYASRNTIQVEAQNHDRRTARCYVALCRLAELLGRILPLLFRSSLSDESRARQKLKDLYHELNDWISDLEEDIDLKSVSCRRIILGLTNLHSSYLAVRMLLSRLGLLLHDEADESYSEWLSSSVEAGSEFTKFARSLGADDLNGFWFPWNAQHFFSAVTLLLRCSLQTSNIETRRDCAENAQSMLSFLKEAQQDNAWDMATLCTSSNQKVLDQVQRVLSSDFYRQRLENNKQNCGTIFYNNVQAMDDHDSSEDGAFADMVAELFPELVLPHGKYSQSTAETPYI